MKDVFKETKKLLGQGQQAVLATVVKTKGSTPQKPGAKLLVRQDGSGVGTLGGGCVEGDIWFAAQQLLKNVGPSQFREYQLNEDLAAEEGLVCGGSMYFMIDPIYEPDEVLGFTKEINHLVDYIQINIVDSGVKEASLTRVGQEAEGLMPSKPVADGIVVVWVKSVSFNEKLEATLVSYANTVYGYLVTESEPLQPAPSEHR